MRITYDPRKRAANLQKHGLDLADASEVFSGPVQTRRDDRRNYGEDRYMTVGYLSRRMVVVVWTPRDNDERRIISMRKANAKEQARYRQRLGEGGRDDR